MKLIAAAILALTITACTTAGEGDPTANVTTPPPTGQTWCLGDSRSLATSSFIGWSWHVDCIRMGQPGQGFVKVSGYGQNLPAEFAALVAERGAPAKVYVSEGINDSLYGIDGRAAMLAFHDTLTRMGIVQVWATSPYAAPWVDPAVNARQEQLNAAMTWAKDCAGPDPSLDTVNDGTGVHQTSAFDEAFAVCIAG